MTKKKCPVRSSKTTNPAILADECLIGFTGDQGQGKSQTINVDDIVETMGHFRGLSEWDHVNGYLTDTCLTGQD